MKRMIGIPNQIMIPTPMARRRRGTPVLARNGMATGAHPLVTSTVLRTLASGGNAVDAAIAGALTASVVLPAMTGIGGDLFAIVSTPDQQNGRSDGPTSILSSGISPRGASLEFMQEHGDEGGRLMPHQGPLAPAVPGFVAGIAALHKRFGSRPLTELATPAIGYAADGFPVSPIVARWLVDQQATLRKYPSTAAVFLRGGAPPKVGEILKQPDLARSIREIAEGGADLFYRGKLAKAISEFLSTNGGALTAEDFADHEATVTPAIQTTYHDYTIYQTGLPTQGFVLLEALNIVEGDDLGSLGVDRAPGIHLMAESLKLAFADRLANAGDPNMVDVPLDRLLSKEWAKERRQRIDLQSAWNPDRAGTLTGGDTTYLCVIDGQGMMISLIISLSGAFGSAVVAGDTGILLNNRAGNCFTFEPDHPNRYAPGKKTIHTLNCFMVGDRDGTPLLVGGTPGGDGQPQWNLQMLAGMIDAGLDVQAATELPRWSIWPATYPAEVGNPFEIRIEAQIGEEIVRELAQLGHRMMVMEPWSMGGAAQLIARDPESGVLAGGSDPRAEGLAVGL
jgi:gamma-glutamyltranspeptidase / glutathione hydrolase